MTHSIHLLAGAFILNALDDGERTAFADHLEDCSDCREETTGLREATALLTQTVAAMPPVVLRRTIISGIARVRPLPPLVAATAALASSLEPHGAGTPSTRRRLRVSLAIAAVVVTTMGAATLHGRSFDDSLASAGSGAQVLQAPDRKHSTVESDAGWAATVWHSDSIHQALIVTEHMPKPPGGMVYQVWLDQPVSGSVSAGLMSGAHDQSLLLEGDAGSANGASVTLEPLGGSTTPTSDPVAVFDFGQGA